MPTAYEMEHIPVNSPAAVRTLPPDDQVTTTRRGRLTALRRQSLRVGREFIREGTVNLQLSGLDPQVGDCEGRKHALRGRANRVAAFYCFRAWGKEGRILRYKIGERLRIPLSMCRPERLPCCGNRGHSLRVGAVIGTASRNDA